MLQTVIHPVRDVEAAKAVYTALLGAGPTIDQPYYVHFQVGDLEVGLDPNGHAKGMTGPLNYWTVDDVAAAVDALVAAGATPGNPPQDVGGRIIATVTDADGNALGLMQQG